MKRSDEQINCLEDFNNSNKNPTEMNNGQIHEEEPIYIMTIELEHGKNANINIFLDSKPEELSYEFCKENNLDFSSMSYLSKQIKGLLDNFSLNSKGKNNDGCIMEVDEEEAITNGKNNSMTQPTITVQHKLSHSVLSSPGNEEKDLKRNLRFINQVKNETPKKQIVLSNGSSSKNNTPTQTIQIHKNYLKNNKLSKYQTESHKLFSYENFFNSLKKKSQMNQSLNNNKQPLKSGHLIPKKRNSNQTQAKGSEKEKEIIIGVIEELKEKLQDEEELKQIIPIKPPIKPKGKSFDLTHHDNHNKSLNQSKEKIVKDNTLTINNTTSLETKSNPTLQNNTRNKDGVSSEKYNTLSSSYTNIKKNAYTNYGERLYEKCKKMEEVSKAQIEVLREKIEMKNKSIYTFKPLLNPNSISIIKEKGDKTLNCTNESIILNYKAVIENQFKNLKQKHPQTIYPHQPTLNQKSLQIANKNPNSSIQNIELLHTSKSRSKEHLNRIENEMYHECSFSPQFTDYTPKNQSFVSYTFNERQHHYHSRSTEKKNKLIEEVHYSKDVLTGQELFHPNLYTKTHKRRNRDVYAELYSYATKYKNNKSLYSESRINSDNEQRQIKLCDNSIKIIDKKKLFAFDKIFDLLDSDDDNSISVICMDLKKIPSTIIQIIQPIIDEMRDINQSLNKEEFRQACINLYTILSSNDKETLLAFHKTLTKKRNNGQCIFPFKPQIDKNSRRIANNSFMFSNSFNLSNEMSSLNTYKMKKENSCKSLG